MFRVSCSGFDACLSIGPMIASKSGARALETSPEVRAQTERMLQNKAQERAAYFAKQKAAMKGAVKVKKRR